MSLLRLRPTERISFFVPHGPARGAHSNAGSCMDAPVHARLFFERFQRVIGCGHVSGLYCSPFMTTGRYGAKRSWRKISSTSSRLTDPVAFPVRLSNLCPYRSLISSHADDPISLQHCYLCLCRGESGNFKFLILCHHRPDAARHFICKCKGDEHTRLA